MLTLQAGWHLVMKRYYFVFPPFNLRLIAPFYTDAKGVLVL